jgi:hypothetical protein
MIGRILLQKCWAVLLVVDKPEELGEEGLIETLGHQTYQGLRRQVELGKQKNQRYQM